MSLPIGVKAGYGAGQLGEATKNAAFTYFLFFHYTQVLGLAPAYTGLALFVATTVDALVDPPLGSWSDRLRHRWGRRHPFMYASSLPLAVSFALVFSPPSGLGSAGLLGWLLVFATLTRALLSAFQVPFMALGAELSDDYRERTSVVAWRATFGAAGQAVVLGVAWTSFFAATPDHANGQMNAAAYPDFGLFGAALIVAATLTASLATHGRIASLRPATEGGRGVAASVGDLRRVLASPSFRALFLCLLTFQTMRGVQEVLSLHLLTFFWGLAPGEILQLTLVAFLALVAGVPIWSVASGYLDKKPTAALGIGLFCVVGILWPLLKLTGAYPAPGTDAYVNLLLLSGLLSGLAGAAVIVASGSMVADVADEADLATGSRIEGALFGAILFATQATNGLGGFLGGAALQVIGFDTQTSVADVAPDLVRALGAIQPIVLTAALLSLLPLARYRINRASHARTAAALAARRTATAPPT